MGFNDDFEQKKIISYNLQGLIIYSGKDQKEIAIDLDVNPPTFNQWVNGKAIPSVSMLKRIATYFGITLSQLVDDPENNPTDVNYSFNEKLLVYSYRKSPQPLKEAAEKLLDVEQNREEYAAYEECVRKMQKTAAKIEEIENTKKDEK